MSGKIKSTIELAMEKAAKLPRLTEEEIRQRREEEYAPRGEAIAELVLRGDLEASRLETELARQGGEEGEIVRRVCLECLCQAPDLEGAAATARAFEAIQAVSQGGDLAEASDRWAGVLREYEALKQQAFSATEETERCVLEELGVSGSAIRLDLEQNQSWRERRSELQQRFRPQLEALKRELSDQLAPAPVASRS